MKGTPLRSSRRTRDKASGVLVTGIISMLFLCLCFGLALDLTKNSYIKNAQNSQTQQATSVAVKRVDAKGSITAESVKKLANEYLVQRGYSIPSSTGLIYESASNTDAKSSYDETAVYRAGEACKTREVPGEGEVSAPYMKITLEPSRRLGAAAPVTYIFKNGNFTGGMEVNQAGQTVPRPSSGVYQDAVTYKVITATVYDSSTNLMLGMFGVPCQKLTSETSSIAFGNQEDLG